MRKCDQCKGKGRIVLFTSADTCNRCKGTGNYAWDCSNITKSQEDWVLKHIDSLFRLKFLEVIGDDEEKARFLYNLNSPSLVSAPSISTTDDPYTLCVSMDLLIPLGPFGSSGGKIKACDHYFILRVEPESIEL